MIYLNILLIAVIVVIVIDNTDFVDNIKKLISSLLTKGKIKSSNYSLKPFDCSLCMTFWISLIYLIIQNQVTLFTITYTLVIALLTPQINDLVKLLQDLITKLINIVYRKIQ